MDYVLMITASKSFQMMLLTITKRLIDSADNDKTTCSIFENSLIITT